MAFSAITRSNGTGAISMRSATTRNGQRRRYRLRGAMRWDCRRCRTTPIHSIRRRVMAPDRRIAIVGGGLAGLAAARALAVFGMRAEVYEQAPALGEIGAAVNTSPNATKALQAIGLAEKIAAVANPSPGMYTRNMQSGEFLEFNDRRKEPLRWGAPFYTYHRADLLDALANSLDPATIHLSHRIA